MNRALFLDRDGVINEDYGYVHKIKDFHFREGIFDVCRAAQRARMKIIVVTNQAGIGRGLYGLAEFKQLTTYMKAVFALEQIIVDGVYYCPAHPTHGMDGYKQDSFDRKPNPGMFIKAANEHNINLSLSAMIGDRLTDFIASRRAGIKCYTDATKENWTTLAIGSFQWIN